MAVGKGDLVTVKALLKDNPDLVFTKDRLRHDTFARGSDHWP